MLTYGEITGVRKNEIIVKVDEDVMRKVLRYRDKNTSLVELRLHDSRTVTNVQRKKFYATINDISNCTGDAREDLEDYFKFQYCYKNKVEKISMSDCSVTEAKELINLVMDFVLMNDIPLKDLGLERTDDINRFLYMCLATRKCSCCGKPADIHHCTGSRVGMGMDRTKINNIGRYAIALCREHHTIAHNSEMDFFNKWKVYGIKLDEYLVKKLGL